MLRGGGKRTKGRSNGRCSTKVSRSTLRTPLQSVLLFTQALTCRCQIHLAVLPPCTETPAPLLTLFPASPPLPPRAPPHPGTDIQEQVPVQQRHHYTPKIILEHTLQASSPHPLSPPPLPFLTQALTYRCRFLSSRATSLRNASSTSCTSDHAALRRVSGVTGTPEGSTLGTTLRGE